MQKKKIVYIAHPISGDIEKNLHSIRRIIRELNLANRHIVPFAPYYVDVVSLDDNNPAERERGIQNDHALLERGFVDEMWLYGSRISDGMREEIAIARRMNIPVIASNDILYGELLHILKLNPYEIAR